MSQELLVDPKSPSSSKSKETKDDIKILEQPLKGLDDLLPSHATESVGNGTELPKSNIPNVGKRTGMIDEDFIEFVKNGLNGSIVDVFNQLNKKVGTKTDSASVATETVKYTYVVLQEVNESETESWQYFIRWEGNEDEIQHLHKIIQSIDWIPIEECSIFYSNIDNRVSERTAKEMSRLDFGSKWRNRKFDGKLERINFGFKKRDRTIEKMHKIFDHIGYGQIEDYVGDEDYSDDSDDDSDYSDHEDSSSDEESDKNESKEKDKHSSSDESESDTEKTTPPTRSQGIPPALLSKNLPRSAKHHRR
jgi:hypothetical protein